MENKEYFTPSEFARLKGVHPSRVTHLKDKLTKFKFLNRWYVANVEENHKLFENPSHLRGTKKESK